MKPSKCCSINSDANDPVLMVGVNIPSNFGGGFENNWKRAGEERIAI